jgi:hypothetical protein
MRELLVVLIIVAVIAMIWYLRSPRSQTAAKPKRDEVRGIQGTVGAADRAERVAAATLPAAAPSRATDIGVGMTDEPAAKSTQARRDAERTAARLSGRGETALAIQSAAAAYGGALPADRIGECPPSYPIKGNASSMLFHQMDSPTYLATIAEYCFSSVEAAEAAGFSSPPREKAAALTQARQDAEPVAASFSIESETRARQDAERVAASFANEPEKALAIQTAAAAYGGALPGDGTRDCPSAYPIKGNATSMLYHEPATPTYLATIAEFCFSSVEAARAAGFSSTRY